MENTVNMPYWRDQQLLETAQVLGKMIAKSGICCDEFSGNVDACTIIVLQANQFNIDPYFLAQHAFPDMYGRLAYTATALEQILKTKIPSLRVKKQYFGDWTKLRGNYRLDKHKVPFTVTPLWKVDEEQGLGITLTFSYVAGEEEYEFSATFLYSDIANDVRLENTNWYSNPERQLYYHAFRHIAYERFGVVLNDMNNEIDEKHRLADDILYDSVPESVGEVETASEELEPFETISMFLEHESEGEFASLSSEERHLRAVNAAKQTLLSCIKQSDRAAFQRWGTREMKQLKLPEKYQTMISDFYQTHTPDIERAGLYE